MSASDIPVISALYRGVFTSPRSDEHLFKTTRAHRAAKLPPTLCISIRTTQASICHWQWTTQMSRTSEAGLAIMFDFVFICLLYFRRKLHPLLFASLPMPQPRSSKAAENINQFTAQLINHTIRQSLSLIRRLG